MSSHSFNDNDVESEIRALAKKFSEKELAPRVAADEASETFRPELIRSLGELGLTGIPLPEAYGGAGLGYREYAIALEEIAAVSGAYAVSVAVTGLTQVIISIFGTDAQKKKVIPRLASGEAIGAFSLSEASSGSDAASLRTTAKLEGDHYVLNGTKLWTTQADSAEFTILMARTGGPGAKGVSAFLIEKGMKGVRFSKREKKMGMSISHTMEIVLENVRVPKENLVGSEGDGFKVAMTALDSGRITIAATAVGIARAALEVATKHARVREQFGKPIIDFQGVSFMLADMATQLEASRLLVKQAAALRDAGEKFSVQASMAKLFATDAAMKIATDAVQVLGGSGYTQDFPAERYMREAKMLQIVEGTNQVQRLVIGRSLTE